MLEGSLVSIISALGIFYQATVWRPLAEFGVGWPLLAQRHFWPGRARVGCVRQSWPTQAIFRASRPQLATTHYRPIIGGERPIPASTLAPHRTTQVQVTQYVLPDISLFIDNG